MPYGQSGFFLSFSLSLLAVTLDDAAAAVFEAVFTNSFLANGLLSVLLLVVVTSTVSLVEAFCVHKLCIYIITVTTVAHKKLNFISSSSYKLQVIYFCVHVHCTSV